MKVKFIAMLDIAKKSTSRFAFRCYDGMEIKRSVSSSFARIIKQFRELLVLLTKDKI
jgi:hypothetical protein